MTEQEAIEVIKKADAYSIEAIEELKTIKDKAIALDKYGEYYSVLQNCLREREACAVAIKALEKQVPKKVEIKHWSPAHCPTCGHTLSESQGDGYYSHPTFLERCPNVECGQRLQWKTKL